MDGEIDSLMTAVNAMDTQKMLSKYSGTDTIAVKIRESCDGWIDNEDIDCSQIWHRSNYSGFACNNGLMRRRRY